MKARNFYMMLTPAVLISAVTLPLFSMPAWATEPTINASKEIADLRSSIVSAEVFVGPKATAILNHGISEKEIRRYGCPYQAVGKEDLGPLLDILVNGEIVEASESDEDFRIAVYLRTRSGAVVPLLMGVEFPDSPMTGTYNAKTPVVAKKGLADELRLWTTQRNSTRQTPRCQK